jgi:hypothetical protein
MRRKWALAGAVLALMSASARAEVTFQGTVKWTNAQWCKFERPGAAYNSTYHPRVPGNMNFSGLTTLYQFGGAGYQLNNADFNHVFRPVLGVGLGWSGYTFRGAKIRVTERSPAVINAGTPFVTMKGEIIRPSNDPGINGHVCVVAFEGAFRRE